MPDEGEPPMGDEDQVPEDEDVPAVLPEPPKEKILRGFRLHLAKKTKDSVEIEVEGGTETILEPLKQALLEDEAVDIATYYIGHPLLDRPKLFLRVKSGKPQAALKKAAKAIAAGFKDGADLVQKPKMRKSES